LEPKQAATDAVSAAVQDALRALVAAPGQRLDIAEGALLLGALDRPGIDLGPYRRDIATLAAMANTRPKPEALNALLFGDWGFAGDTETYDDLRNANLTHVIDRRLGLPVALGILYIHVARAAGLAAFGLNLPGHVMVAVGAGESMHVRDPFHGGRVVGLDELGERVARSTGPGAVLERTMLQPMDDRAVLLRLHNNIKVRCVRDGDVDRAAATLEAMVIVAPDQAGLWFELGMAHDKRDNLRAARAALERARTLAGAAEARDIEIALRGLRGRMN
jgi:regulator of sirC expression with transglutaminase-like and TPR domain